MKKRIVRNIAKLLNKSIWFRPVLVSLICFVVFLLSRSRTFSSEAITVVNLVLLLLGLFLLFLQIQKKCLVECWIYCILILAATINKLYDESVFRGIFHVPFSVGIMVVVIFGIIRIAGFFILRMLRNATNFVEEAVEGWGEAEKERQQNEKEKSSIRERVAYVPQQQLHKDKEPIDTTEVKTYTSENVMETLSTNDRIMSVVMLAVSLLLPIGYGVLFFFSLPKFLENYSQDTDFKSITVFLNFSTSIFTTLVLVLIMWAVFLGLLLEIWFCGKKLLSELKKPLTKNEPETSFPIKLLIHTITVVIICIYWSNNKTLTTDEVSGLLADGSLFIYPVMIAVVLPVYLLLVDWITDKKKWKQFLTSENVKGINKILGEISVGSVMALLNFIKFVTNDFLASIQELAIEEEEKDDEEGDTEKDEADQKEKTDETSKRGSSNA